MLKERIRYFTGLAVIFNLILLYMILQPQLLRLKGQIEQGGAIETSVNTPLYNDYYYDYIFTDSKKEGNWQIDTYKEVKRIVDENGQKLKEIETGNVEYMRYWLGDPTEVIEQFIDEELEGDHHDH